VPEPGPRQWPVAYCPPGKATLTRIALQLKGYDVARVTEHPWLDDSMGVILVADPGELIPDPEAFRIYESPT
jgi:hypothetical protein